MNFQPSDVAQERDLNDLSDGQQSLFYLSLVAAVFDVERKIARSTSLSVATESEKDKGDPKTEDDELTVLGFERERLQFPALTIEVGWI